MRLRKSSSVIWERATPSTANSFESKSARARLCSAGISMRAVRSPAAPKMVMMQGSLCLPKRGGGVAAGCSTAWAMNRVLGNFGVSGKQVLEFLDRPAACLRRLFGFGRAGFDVAAEFLAHGREHFFGECMLLARTETDVERGGQNIRGDGFFQRGLNRPTSLAGILHVAFVFRERGIF